MSLAVALPAPGVPLACAVAAATASLWLLLPGNRLVGEGRVVRWTGLLLGSAALVALALTGRRLGGLGEDAVFLIVAAVAVVSGAATVVSRSPVYAAIWFALTLAGVAGVLLVLGAQFLGVATIVVYAGAILVMFLFVLMLAQPAGLAPYDRVSNEPLLSALAGAVLLGLLTLSIGRLSAAPPTGCQAPSRATARDGTDTGVAPAADATDPFATDPFATDPFATDHVARLGAELFGRHLLAVEAAGVLLLVALVGSIAMVSRGATTHEAEGRSLP